MSDPKPNPLADPEVVKGRADWDEYGVEEWAAVAKPPLIYAPPQLTPAKTGFNPCNPSVVQHRDLVCYPLASCFLSCCFHPDVSKWGDNAEATAAKMLDAHAPGSFNKCPKPFRGLFWLENNTASETVTTFEDAIWSDDGLRGMKNSTDNWLRDYTCCGSMIVILSGVVGWSISKDGKWLMWGKADPMYIVQEGDKFINPDGSPYEPAIEVGDLVRCSYWGKNVEQTADKWVYDDALGVYSNANLQFQYVIRRLAYRDEDSGELTKTKRSPGGQRSHHRATLPRNLLGTFPVGTGTASRSSPSTNTRPPASGRASAAAGARLSSPHLASPRLAAPLLSSPLLSSPLPSSPLLSSPLRSSPLLSSHRLASPCLSSPHFASPRLSSHLPAHRLASPLLSSLRRAHPRPPLLAPSPTPSPARRSVSAGAPAARPASRT